MRDISKITVVIGGVIKTNYEHTVVDVIFARHKVAGLVALVITRLSFK